MDTCPECGAIVRLGGVDPSNPKMYWDHLDDGLPDIPLWLQGGYAADARLYCLTRQLAAANAIIEKLPTYVDTGERIAPGMILWVITDDAGVQGDIAGPIHCSDYDGHEASGCYSTEAAAEAAKEQK